MDMINYIFLFLFSDAETVGFIKRIYDFIYAHDNAANLHNKKQ